MAGKRSEQITCPCCGWRRPLRTTMFGGRVLTKEDDPEGDHWHFGDVDFDAGWIVQFAVSHGREKYPPGHTLAGKYKGFTTDGGLTLEQVAADPKYAAILDEALEACERAAERIRDARGKRSGSGRSGGSGRDI